MLYIEGHDFSNCIVADTYQVNEVDVYTDFLDGDYRTHRYVTRSRVSGTLTLHPRTSDDADAFKTIVNAKVGKNPYYEITLDVNNTGKTRMITAMISYVTNHKRQGSADSFNEFVLTIEER